MNRKEILEVFLALATAARDGIITDTLWMPAGQETVFEFFADKISYPGNLAHIDSLVESLEDELALAKQISWRAGDSVTVEIEGKNRIGKVVRLSESSDFVTVDFGNGDVYGITPNRITAGGRTTESEDE